MINRIANFADPRSWQCWRATRRLGGINFDAYCQSLGYSGANYTSARYAYGWSCTGAPQSGVDAQRACATLYHTTAAISRFQDYYDKSSWECWR